MTQRRLNDYGDYEGENGLRYARDYPEPSSGELDWLNRVADEEGDPICELACGHGRLCIPLARNGHRVVGLDRSHTLINLAIHQAMHEPESVRSRLRFVMADLCRFELGEQFGYIFIFFGGFFSLRTHSERASCLAQVHKHLHDGGLLEIEDPNPGPPSVPRQEMKQLLADAGLTLESALKAHRFPLENTPDDEPALLYRARKLQMRREAGA